MFPSIGPAPGRSAGRRQAWASGAPIAVALLLAALAGAGCVGGRPAVERQAGEGRADWNAGAIDSAAASEVACAAFGGAAPSGDTLTVELPGAIDPRGAPIPHDDAERVVFRHLYETLVALDPDGRPLPRLAVAWESDGHGQRWIFTLRREARFWDGQRVTAESVRSVWAECEQRAHASGCPGPWLWLSAQDASVRALDDRRLAITLPEAQPDFPLLLAHPAFAVSRRSGESEWPLGSGAWVPRRTGVDSLLCTPSPYAARGGAPAGLLFLTGVAGAAGSRDLPGADFILLRERDAARPAPAGYASCDLPWDRVYLLLTPGPGGDAEAPPAPIAPAVGVAAVSGPFFPGARPGACPQVAAPTAMARPVLPARRSRQDRRVAFPADDALARELAEQVAARRDLQSEAVAAADWPLALRDGASAAFVAPFQRCLPADCLQLAGLLGAAPWLRDSALGGQDLEPRRIARRLEESGLVAPLAMTRCRVLAREGLGGLRADYDATLRLDVAGRAQSR